MVNKQNNMETCKAQVSLKTAANCAINRDTKEQKIKRNTKESNILLYKNADNSLPKAVLNKYAISVNLKADNVWLFFHVSCGSEYDSTVWEHK